MRKFDLSGLRDRLSDPESVSNGIPDAFVEEVHDFCKHENDLAERFRTLRFTRTELATVKKGLSAGAGKK
jgi:hypothetical protein